MPIFNGSSLDGTRVFFSSEEKLVGADADSATDVYARDLPAGPTILISGGSEDVTASFSAASADGAHVFFTSAEDLLEADEDGVNDVYEWTGGTLKLITSAPCASVCSANFDAVSADSTLVLFTTAAALVAADEDKNDDIYRQDVGGGAPVLVSRGEAQLPSCWNGDFDARFNQASADASRVVFTTAEGVLAEDKDGEDDIYLRDVDAGAGSLITIAPSYCPLKKGNCGATFVGSSHDGGHVFFRTVERFTLEDGDNEADVYERFLGSEPSEEDHAARLDRQRPESRSRPGAADADRHRPRLSGPGDDPADPRRSDRLRGEDLHERRLRRRTGGGRHRGGAARPGAAGHRGTELADDLQGDRRSGRVRLRLLAADLLPAPSAAGGGEEGGGLQAPNVGSPGAPSPEVRLLVPHTRITFAPASKTRSRSPVFRFTDSTGQSGTTFQCKIDRKPWRGCGSPLRLKRLNRGRHVLEIKASTPPGNAEPKPVKRAFKVVPR